MGLFSVILPPLVGGVIGYITNDLAIKMLFRPYTAKYIGRFRVPFTPGIVPKRLEALAVLLGREVEARFFNADDLEILFKSDTFSEAVAGSIADMLYSRRGSLCLIMENLEADERTGPAIQRAKAELSRQIISALTAFNFVPLICAAGEQAGSDRRSDGLPRGSMKNTVRMLAPSLSDGIRSYLKKSGEATIAPLVEEMLVDFGDRPVRDIVSGVFPERELAKELLKELYQSFIGQYVRPVVESIDVGGMITEKLRRMEPEAVEALILSVVKREFRYVVWLGGLLGLLIGMVNIFI